MNTADLSASLVGTEFEPSTFNWARRDCVIYALGVGARPEDDLDFVYEGQGPVVLPTYAVIPGMAVLRGRFADQVWPGDRIVTKMWHDGDDAAIVQAETHDGTIVFSQARATTTGA